MIDPLADLCDPLIHMGNKSSNLIAIKEAEGFNFKVNR